MMFVLIIWINEQFSQKITWKRGSKGIIDLVWFPREKVANDFAENFFERYIYI